MIAFFLSLLLFVLLFYFSFNGQRKLRNNWLHKIETRLNAGILLKADRVIVQIKRIAQSNSEYQPLLEELINSYDEIENNHKNARVAFKAFQKQAYRLSRKEFKVGMTHLRSQVEIFEKSGDKFEKIANQFTRKNQFIRAEMIYLKNNLRTIIKQYRDHRVLLNPVAHKIDKTLQTLNDYEKEFEQTLDLGKNRASLKWLNKYEQAILDLAITIDQAPVIRNHLYSRVPERVSKLVKSYQNRFGKNSNRTAGVENKIKKIVKVHQQARLYFENLNLEKCKLSVIGCHQMISKFEKEFYVEVESQKLFKKHYPSLASEFKKLQDHIQKLRQMYRSAVEQGKQIGHELLDNFDALDRQNKVTLANYQEWKKSLTQENFSPLRKIEQMKAIVLQIGKMVTLAKHCEKLIWDLSVKSIKYQNKFRQLKSALEELVFEMRTHKIALNAERKKSLTNLLAQVSQINPLSLENEIDRETSEKIDQLTKQIAKLYQAVNLDLQIARMAKNMIKELSIQRGLNKRLAYVLSKAEKDFMAGQYSDALNGIIAYLGEVKYA